MKRNTLVLVAFFSSFLSVTALARVTSMKGGGSPYSINMPEGGGSPYSINMPEGGGSPYSINMPEGGGTL